AGAEDSLDRVRSFDAVPPRAEASARSEAGADPHRLLRATGAIMMR
ncbi:MAG: hypothetical protein H6Q89_1140, partial [Myxococcaceae bacterium]|nr:hypothetical protein [Myxococcaceae bacterium]